MYGGMWAARWVGVCSGLRSCDRLLFEEDCQTLCRSNNGQELLTCQEFMQERPCLDLGVFHGRKVVEQCQV
jgi:hypothetical protein